MNLGNKIKELRIENGMTQEKLASLAGVSMQSVSRWENEKTYPDITLLPVLANIFKITTDEILGVDLYKEDEYIKNVLEKNEYLANIGDSLAEINLLKETLREYPNNFILMGELAITLYGYYCADDLNRKDCLVELIELCKKIINECRDDKIRNNSIQILCYAYKSNNEIDKAIEIANKMPSLSATRDSLLASIFKGDDKIRQVQKNIYNLFTYLHIEIRALRKNDPEYDIKLFEKHINILDIAFEEKDYGFYNIYLMEDYLEITGGYVRLNNLDKAFDYLNKAIDHAKAYQTRSAKSKHKSMLFDKLYDEKDKSMKNTTNTEKDIILMKLGKSIFTKMREDARWQHILYKLNEVN